ncbi:MAG: hypothetical protein GY694_22005 [Gammaproteobacteria bacterium]|nr:hypothetical protein [Gammaproteobacteria bacterium]
MNKQQSLSQYMQTLGQTARQAANLLSKASTRQKNNALNAIAGQLRANETTLLAANIRDVESGRNNALDAALLDRLEL